ncbi:unnamed protein product [Closterium sp. NIES-65]|nr:unnamed protein product [Closterium sp. NIES-65]
MAVDVASMSVEELEAVWLRRAGMRSDLSVTIPGMTAPGVTVPGFSFNVHKYPLYARTDFFQESSTEDPDSGRNHIDIVGLPGGERAFKQVASFCYGMDFKISPLDAPALACAAVFLGMTDDSSKGIGKYRVNLLSFCPSLTPLLSSLSSLRSAPLPSPTPPATFLGMTDDPRKGMGKYRVNLLSLSAFLGMKDDSRKGMGKYRVNLLSFAAAAMAGMLKHADAALAVLRGCAGLLAEADALGIVDEATDRLADHAVTSHNLCTTPIHTSDGIALLPLNIFLRLLAKFKEKNLPEKENGSAIAFYAQHNLPDPKSLAALSHSDPPPPHSSSTSSSSASSLSPAHYRRVLEGLTAALPAAAASVPMQPLLGLLRCAIVLNASEGVKATLQRRAGALFTDASLDDLLMLETSDVQVRFGEVGSGAEGLSALACGSGGALSMFHSFPLSFPPLPLPLSMFHSFPLSFPPLPLPLSMFHSFPLSFPPLPLPLSMFHSFPLSFPPLPLPLSMFHSFPLSFPPLPLPLSMFHSFPLSFPPLPLPLSMFHSFPLSFPPLPLPLSMFHSFPLSFPPLPLPLSMFHSFPLSFPPLPLPVIPPSPAPCHSPLSRSLSFPPLPLPVIPRYSLSPHQGLLHGFASEEHLSALPDRAQALQAAASLIDAYLLRLSSPRCAGGAPASNEAAAIEDETSKSESQAFQPALSVAEWKHLVSALPADARPSHDGLLKTSQKQPRFTWPAVSVAKWKHLACALPADARTSHDGLSKAVTAYLTAVGTGLAEWEVATLVGVVTPSRLSPSAMEAAAACSLLPLPFLVAVLRIQKEVWSQLNSHHSL